MLSVRSWRRRSGRGGCLFVSLFIDPNRFLSLFLSLTHTHSLSLCLCLLYNCMQSEHRIAYLDNKATTPIRSNEWLLIVDGEFFLSLNCQHPGNVVPTNHSDSEKKFRMNCYSLSVDLSNTAWGQWGLINKLPRNAFGADARIRPK